MFFSTIGATIDAFGDETKFPRLKSNHIYRNNIDFEQLITQSRLGKIRLEAYLYLHGLFESPFLEPSKLSIINRIWCGIYLITEFIVGAYLLQQQELDIPWFVMIAPILAGLLNLATGILKGQLIVYPKALAELRQKYEQYEYKI